MAKKILIEIFQKKCVGNAICEKRSPNYFKVVEGKATNPGGYLKDDIFSLKASVDEDTKKKIIEAGNSCPVNAINVIDIESDKELVSNEVVESENVRIIKAQYDDLKEFVMDPKGYFLIRVNSEQKEIEVGFCREKNKIEVKIIGKNSTDIYQTIIRENLVSRMDHCAYLGKELEKAYIALQNGLEYVQSCELNTSK